MNAQKVALLSIGALVTTLSISFAFITEVSPLMAGLGVFVGVSIILIVYRPDTLFQSLFGISLATIAVGGYLFIANRLAVGGIIAVLGIALGGRSLQLYRNKN
ncbi:MULTISPECIES: hypothetical protein [unclassified Haloferax]|uniref:hypothetical protein n=1 Tax=unclassified Haloferax TaxID=2625095 RepID=UPI0012671769|nr:MULTISPECIES: hypothetical protein [unclassified Haloferax]